MKWAGPFQEGTFLSRASRFSCWVEVSGERVLAHLSNSGRLKDLLQPGRKLFLNQTSAPHRRTGYDLILVSLRNRLVSVDARLPSALIEEALRAGKLEPFRSYHQIKREVSYGGKRLDFQLKGEEGACFLEVKSVTLVEGGQALFPDAPTLRGREHLERLIQAREEGFQAAISFVAQRSDARAFSPNDKTDPAFGSLLREARARGVGVYAFGCHVSLREIKISHELPVEL